MRDRVDKPCAEDQVRKAFQPPSAGGFLLARRVTTPPQSEGASSAFTPACRSHCAMSCAALLPKAMFVVCRITTGRPSKPALRKSSFAFAMFCPTVNHSVAASFSIGVPQPK